MLTKILIYSFGIVGLCGVGFATVFLHPSYIGGASSNGLVLFTLLILISLSLIDKHPNSALKLLIISVLAHLTIITSYMFFGTGDVNWRSLDFPLMILRFSYVCFLIPIYLLWKNK
ncbi:hypothetical protein ACFL22_00685 [Patescibacteria group bacterium]